jgi:peptidyl-prolyl cis-trans isomerase C
MARHLLIAFLACLLVVPAMAQTQPKPKEKEKKEAPAAKAPAAAATATDDPVVARVNGAAIYRSDLQALASTLPAQARQQPQAQLYPRLLEQKVAMTLVVQNARKAKLDNEPRVKKMLALADENVLQEAYFDSIIRKEVTEPNIRARYDQFIKTAPPRDEVHARHILVSSEADAKAIIEQLNKGADFAKLASEKTNDPAGKASGGDLGYFTQADMVPEFAQAAFALKVGEYTKAPVKTQFGWHVIKLEDRRQGNQPTYEQVAPQIARQMTQEIYGAKVKELAAASKIEVFNSDGSKPPAAAPAGAAPAAGAPAAGAPEPEPALAPMGGGSSEGAPGSGGPPKLSPLTAPGQLGK